MAGDLMPQDYSPRFATKITGTVGTTATNFAHSLQTTPNIVLLTVTGTVAGVIRVTARDATNITVVSTLASTTFEAFVW